jgi:two-component system nitrate/nitrite response regulator NarL
MNAPGPVPGRVVPISVMGSEQQHIRVLVVDDHDLVRAGLIALLGHEQDIVIVGDACNGVEAREKVAVLLPDVVLMDINMPAMDGVDATTRITKDHPGVRVLVVTHLEHEEYVKKIMRSGASGYVLKNCAAEELKQAVRTVHAGGQFFSPWVLKVMMDNTAAGSSAGETVKGVSLTPREREVLQLVASGNSNQEIAASLRISVRTVEFHRANLIEKIGARDAISLVRFALEQKIISLEM